MMIDGTKSCVVISRGVERYDTELALDHTKPIRVDGVEAASSLSQMDAPISIGQRKLEFIPPMNTVDDSFYPVSKRMTSFATSSSRTARTSRRS